jgi:hypothetical protein
MSLISSAATAPEALRQVFAYDSSTDEHARKAVYIGVQQSCHDIEQCQHVMPLTAAHDPMTPVHKHMSRKMYI